MSHVRWLRICYWTGAVADAAAGVAILIPGMMGETELRYPMGLASALMFGWTALLIWADRKPVERKGVLLLTVFPVITGLLASGIYGGVTGQLPVPVVVARTVVMILLISLFLYGYTKAGRSGLSFHRSEKD
jgi:FtsH-binding integral membrane protein